MPLRYEETRWPNGNLKSKELKDGDGWDNVWDRSYFNDVDEYREDGTRQYSRYKDIDGKTTQTWYDNQGKYPVRSLENVEELKERIGSYVTVRTETEKLYYPDTNQVEHQRETIEKNGFSHNRVKEKYTHFTPKGINDTLLYKARKDLEKLKERRNKSKEPQHKNSNVVQRQLDSNVAAKLKDTQNG